MAIAAIQKVCSGNIEGEGMEAGERRHVCRRRRLEKSLLPPPSS